MRRKKQKHPRLPNGFGSIRYLGPNRSRPYMISAPATMDGDKVIPGTILTYTDDWYQAYAILTAYNAGTWHPGDDLSISPSKDPEGLDGLISRLLDDFKILNGKVYDYRPSETFKAVADRWYKDKYERPEIRKFSESTKQNIHKGLSNLEIINDRPFSSLRLDDLQDVIDQIDAPTMQDQARAVLHGIYKYAVTHEIVEKDYSAGLVVMAHEKEHGVPFTPDEIRKLYELREDPIAEMLLIMIYSGFRISAYRDMTVNLKERYFQGGVKTAAGKDRIVPIHSFIYPMVKKRKVLVPDLQRYGAKLGEWCRRNGMDHSPHHTRHTFSALCEKYEVKENDRKRLLGHAFQDVTNSVYGHRDLEDLRKEIEKIPPPWEL